MTRGLYIRCNIREYNWELSCRKKATVWSWIDEYDGGTTIVDLCKMHEKWLCRSEEDDYLYPNEWLAKYAK